MQSDGLYRFVALRSPELTARDKPGDPFINAYGDNAEAPTALFTSVSTSLASNDLRTAQSACEQFVGGLELASADPWELAKDTPLRSLCVKLAALVRRGADADAAKISVPHAGDSTT